MPLAVKLILLLWLITPAFYFMGKSEYIFRFIRNELIIDTKYLWVQGKYHFRFRVQRYLFKKNIMMVI